MIERRDNRPGQLAGIVTTGALLLVSASASAIRFCTTVNAYFESKSLRSTQYIDGPYAIDTYASTGAVLPECRSIVGRVSPPIRPTVGLVEPSAMRSSGTCTCAPRSLRMPSTERV